MSGEGGRTAPVGEAGFTLIELMISLALFALIAVAGLALVDGILGVQGRTEGRLDRLADLQRAMFVVSSDFDQVARGDISGDAAGVQFTRSAAGFGGPAVPVRYAMAGGTIVRAAPGPQLLLGGVSGARWRYFDEGWVDRWPPSEQARDRWPRAVALEMVVADGGGAPRPLRRVVVLPMRPKETP
jgi:general secretion pathway protein J